MRSITGSSGFISWAESRTATSLLRGHPGEQRHDLLRAPEVEVGQRLVEQQQLRPADQGVGDQDPLLLAAGERADPAVGEAARRRRRRASRRRARRCAFVRRPNPNRWPSSPSADQVPGPHRHVGVEDDLLGHVAERSAPRSATAAAPSTDRAAVGPLQCRGSPGAAWSCPTPFDPMSPVNSPGRISKETSSRTRPAAEGDTDPVDLGGRGQRSQVLRRGAVLHGGLDRGHLGQHPRLVVVARGRHRLVHTDHGHAGRLRRLPDRASVSESTTCWL